MTRDAARTEDGFGLCCAALDEALAVPTGHGFFIDEGEVRVSLGFVVEITGPRTVERRVLFCPFCGTRLLPRPPQPSRS